ncbi:MAG: cytidine deaminase [Lachnospiraceae bacterium]|nr:cytidine deaminase [Lachnospiraceae bacterium]
MTELQKKDLLEQAKQARKFSYAPYSEYCVGAALLCNDGTVFTGCNIENAAFGDTVCAERTAIFQAVSKGFQDFTAIAIAGSPKQENISQASYPCGSCRQVMREFCNPDQFLVLVADHDDSFHECLLGDLLPRGFGPDNLTD